MSARALVSALALVSLFVHLCLTVHACGVLQDRERKWRAAQHVDVISIHVQGGTDGTLDSLAYHRIHKLLIFFVHVAHARLLKNLSASCCARFLRSTHKVKRLLIQDSSKKWPDVCM